jgi:predicted GIY-YIG superfamily endonuclease
MTWHVYMVRCNDDSLYTGLTNDLAARVAKHNSGDGAKYTRSRRPVRLVWQEKQKTSSAARKREAEIKSWTKAEKERLVK